MKITVVEVRADATRARECEIDAPAEGLLLKDAVAALEKLGIAIGPRDGLSVFAKRIRPEELLREGDRLEITRPLLCDPKEARRRHAEAQGDVRYVTRGRHGGRRRTQMAGE